MRGARGLLISITGGNDLTLYEVDEAATRIREEVDPEANIILGATFDDTLEGIMRVSVVATGISHEGAMERPVYESSHSDNYYASQPDYGSDYSDQPAEPVEPEYAPAAAEEPTPSVQAEAMEPEQPEHAVEETWTEDAPYEAEISIERPTAPAPEEEMPAPAPMVASAHAQQAEQAGMRMPEIDEFPPIAQRQIAAKKGQVVEDLANHAQSRRKGFLERLANVGLGRKEPVAIPVDPVEPTLSNQFGAEEPQPQPRAVEARPASAPTGQVRAEESRIDPALDDEQLEIPAFLRRQAN